MILKRQLAKNKKKGFTLIELIVVIVIIAIIAAIAVPALTRYIESANNRAAQAMAHNIQVVLQAEVTDFYNSTPVAAIADDTDPLFRTGAGYIVPDEYVDGTDFTNEVNTILAFNGVIIESGSLTDISFEGKRLSGFTYEHNNGTTVIYLNGIYDFG